MRPSLLHYEALAASRARDPLEVGCRSAAQSRAEAFARAEAYRLRSKFSSNPASYLSSVDGLKASQQQRNLLPGGIFVQTSTAAAPPLAISKFGETRSKRQRTFASLHSHLICGVGVGIVRSAPPSPRRDNLVDARPRSMDVFLEEFAESASA